MSGRGPIINGLILLAATGFLSACNVHHQSGGTVYKPHHGAVRTGPVETRSTVVRPHRDRYRSARYRRDRHGRYHRDRAGRYYRDRDGRYRRGDRYRRQGQPSPPATAKRPNPPAHGLYGTQPGHLIRKPGPNNPASPTARTSKRQGGKSTRYGSQGRKTVKRGPSAPAYPAKTPKSTILKTGPLKGNAARQDGRSRKSVKRPPSAATRPAKPPKRAPDTPVEILKGKQRDKAGTGDS